MNRRPYLTACAIGLLAGPAVIPLALYASPICALGFMTSVLSAMVICTAKGIA